VSEGKVVQAMMMQMMTSWSKRQTHGYEKQKLANNRR
jgi:hypothetical protein